MDLNSIDTNILIYAVNKNCAEHESSKSVYQSILDNPHKWIIADQVLFEFFAALKNPKILEKPLTQKQALEQIRFLREESGALHCSYQASSWQTLIETLKSSKTKDKIIFDYILAVTLKNNGVKNFYTRNKKDFNDLRFFNVIDPVK